MMVGLNLRYSNSDGYGTVLCWLSVFKKIAEKHQGRSNLDGEMWSFMN